MNIDDLRLCWESRDYHLDTFSIFDVKICISTKLQHPPTNPFLLEVKALREGCCFC